MLQNIAVIVHMFIIFVKLLLRSFLFACTFPTQVPYYGGNLLYNRKKLYYNTTVSYEGCVYAESSSAQYIHCSQQQKITRIDHFQKTKCSQVLHFMLAPLPLITVIQQQSFSSIIIILPKCCQFSEINFNIILPDEALTFQFNV